MIKTYRYPVKRHVEKKGMVHYVHGYGENLYNYAFLGQMFASNGYEFFGMDQRGFGQSEGIKGRVEGI